MDKKPECTTFRCKKTAKFKVEVDSISIGTKLVKRYCCYAHTSSVLSDLVSLYLNDPNAIQPVPFDITEL